MYSTSNLFGDAESIFCSFAFSGPIKPVVETSAKPEAIDVQDRSPITLTIGDNATALTNTSITIQCPTSGVPKPTVTWTKDGQELQSVSRYIVQDDSSLLITGADKVDNARYTCTAESLVGKDGASSILVVVGKCRREEPLQNTSSLGSGKCANSLSLFQKYTYKKKYSASKA